MVSTSTTFYRRRKEGLQMGDISDMSARSSWMGEKEDEKSASVSLV